MPILEALINDCKGEFIMKRIMKEVFIHLIYGVVGFMLAMMIERWVMLYFFI